MGRQEAVLHRYFDEIRLEGEWFHFGDADPVAAIAALLSGPEALPSWEEYRRVNERDRKRRSRGYTTPVVEYVEHAA
jgi:hypothetical protein